MSLTENRLWAIKKILIQAHLVHAHDFMSKSFFIFCTMMNLCALLHYLLELYRTRTYVYETAIKLLLRQDTCVYGIKTRYFSLIAYICQKTKELMHDLVFCEYLALLVAPIYIFLSGDVQNFTFCFLFESLRRKKK